MLRHGSTASQPTSHHATTRPHTATHCGIVILHRAVPTRAKMFHAKILGDCFSVGVLV